MKKALIISLIFAMVFSAVGCETGGTANVSSKLYKDDGYSISIPEKGYRYEKDYDDGAIEDKWESITRDDTEIRVITYKNTDGKTAQSRFLRENDDYVFEDLLGYPLCGTEMDGDTLWFNLYEANGNTYIVSWEYPGYADKRTKEELSSIAQTFKIE